MKKCLLFALMPLLVVGASLSPICPQLTNGAGGFLFDGTWHSRAALPLDDGNVLFIARNPEAKNYIAVLKSSGTNVEVARYGCVTSYIGLQANDNWNVFRLGRSGLYGTISYFNEKAFLYVSDGSMGIYAMMVEGMPLDGKLDENELAALRIAASGNGKVVAAQVSSQAMTVFKRRDDGKWSSSTRQTEDFNSDLFRGIALDYDGTRMWHFTEQEQGCWLTLTELADDGKENDIAVVKVDDDTQRSYYVACTDDGNVVYFTQYINGTAMLMKGVYDGESLKTQIVSWGVDGMVADGDSRLPACSADGRFAVFASKATNLTADKVDGTFWQIFVYDSLRNEIKLMSKLNGSEADADCEAPMISAGGHYVTFSSAAANFNVIKTDVSHLYRVECENADETQGVVAAGAMFERIAVDDAGGSVVFSTDAMLAVGDDNILKNVYGRDVTAGVTYAVSPLDSQDYLQCTISGDGRQAVYVPYQGDDSIWPDLNRLDDVCSLALDFDGDVLACIDKNGRLIRQERGKKPVILATDATDTTGDSSTVRLSHDGTMLVYTFKTASGKATGLKAWFAETGRFVTLMEDSPKYVHVSQSGHYVFYRKKDYKLYRQETTGGAPVVVSEGDLFAISRDGRYAFHDTQTSTLLVRQELFGNKAVIEVGDSSGTHYSTIASSANGDRVFYVQNGALVYDTLPVADEGTTTVTGTCATDIMENTGDETAYEIALQMSGNADYALRLVGDISANGGAISLLYPNGTRPWYALSYVPKMYFCGTDTVTVELWNGYEWFTADLSIDVENVNNPPEWTKEAVALDAKENNVSGKLSLDELLIDYDLDYVEITGEEIDLSVKGPDASKLLRLDGGVIHADLTGRFDLVARGGGILTYSITAMDKAGGKAAMTLTLNIANTDRPPTLTKVEATAYEGLPIEWPWFGIDDPDTEDTEDNLRLCFQSRHAEFYGNDGKKLDAASGVYKSQFPITYRSTCNIQQDTIDVWAKDLDGLTSDSVTMAVEAAYIEVPLAELYGIEIDGRMEWKGVSKGWNLLSVPNDIPEDGMAAYKAMMGLDAVWRWNGKCFEEATLLHSDEGFWGYVSELPDEPPSGTLAGRRAFTPLHRGWNLRGAYGASQGGLLWMLEKNRRHTMLVQQPEAMQGFGHWIFVK